MKVSATYWFSLAAAACIATTACGATDAPESAPDAAPLSPDASSPNDDPPDGELPPLRLAVDFDDGTFAPLIRSFGPRDDPATADPAFTVEVVDGVARFLAPAAAPGPRLTGFLDLPGDMVPIAGRLVHEWSFPNAAELLSLGNGDASQIAVAGCYIRGGLQDGVGDWVGGLFGDYWLGYTFTGGQALSVIRQGTNNLVTEPFTAESSVSYRLEKDGLALRLFANYDDQGWHQVGDDITIAVQPGGSSDVAITHVRVLDLSGAAVDTSVEDLRWYWD